MAELAKWPEVEVNRNPLDPEDAAVAPVEIRFQLKPDPGQTWDTELAAECSVAGQPAPSPGAVLSFREWEKEEQPTLYCYTLARNVQDGAKVKLRVHPRAKKRRQEPGVLWERDFVVRAEGDKYRLE